MSGSSPSFVTPSELLLLRGALLEGSDAVDAAQQWLADHRVEAAQGFQCLESGSRRILPLLFHNVKQHLEPDVRAQLRQVSLEYWAQNQKLLHRLEKLLARLQSEGIPTLVLKGLALSRMHYGDMALRPTSDLDILVPESDARGVIRSLQRNGWTNNYFFSRAPELDYFYSHVHSITFTHPDYGDLDLHWHALYVATFPGADRHFWSGSVPLPLKNMTTRTLSATDQLLHACVHGYEANDLAPIRWIADAMIVLRTSQIDWARLVQVAKQLSITVPLGASLSFLRATFPTPIPMQIIRELASVRVKSSEKKYFERLASPHRRWQEIVADSWERHCRATRNVNPIRRLASLPRELQLHYNLPRLVDLGPFALSLVGKRFTRIAGQS
jgi:hypothetical protein